jgi:hypothetical protein
MPRVQAGLIKQRIEPAPFLYLSELVIFNPFDHSFESAVWFFCRVRGARGSIGP